MQSIFRFIVCVLIVCTLWFPEHPNAQTEIDSDNKTEHLLNPFLLRYQGFGNFMGAAYLGRNAFFKKGDIFAIQSVIDKPVTVIGIRNFTIPLFYSSLYTAYFYSKGTQLPYTLTRGMHKQDAYNFDADTEGWLIGISGSISDQRIVTGRFTYASVSENVFGVKDRNYKLLYSPKTNLSFFNGSIISMMFQFNLIDNEHHPRSGLIGGMSFADINPQNLYSNISTVDLFTSVYIPLKNFTFTGHFYHSTSSATRKRDGASPELTNQFMSECTGTKSDFSESERQSACNEFVQRYMTYLTALNNRGLSSPLGGPNMLRSENFLQYQGSVTYYQSLELRYIDPSIRNGTIEFALFAESGQTYDPDTADKYKKPLNANGIGIRLIDPQVVYRLDFATSKNNSAIYLTINHPW